MTTMCGNNLHDLDRLGARLEGRRNGRVCTECSRLNDAESSRRHRQRTKAYVDAYKLAMGCASCGYAEHAAALQFDHIVTRSELGQRDKWISGGRGMAEARKIMEDPNVQVLCANCHAIKTAGDVLALMMMGDPT